MNSALMDKAISLTVTANRKHRLMIDQEVRRIGFRRTSHMILMCLAKTNRVLSQKELAESFAITPAAITGILKDLESEGYITRSAGRDGRVNEITITPLGREIIEKSKEVFRNIDAVMFEGFSDEDLMTYIRLAEKMSENMNRARDDIE